MSFLKISDPKKRDEIVKEFIERKKSIYQDSVNNNLSEASFQTDLTKMYKPLLDSNNTIKESLKGAADKLREGMLSITSSPQALTSSPQALTSSPQALTSSSFPHTTPEMLTDDKQKFMNVGKIAAWYLKMFTSSKNQIDKTFGVHLKEGELFLEKDPITIDDNDIIIDDKTYPGTAGLWELITKNDPDETIYNDEDVKNYGEIVLDTRAIESDSNPNKPKASRRTKYRELIKPIWDEVKLKNKCKKGSGVVFLPGDPSALIEKLGMSIAAWRTGNTGSRNEAVSICHELLRQGVIDSTEYKAIQRMLR